MKPLYLLALLFLIVVYSACKKNNAPSLEKLYGNRMYTGWDTTIEIYNVRTGYHVSSGVHSGLMAITRVNGSSFTLKGALVADSWAPYVEISQNDNGHFVEFAGATESFFNIVPCHFFYYYLKDSFSCDCFVQGNGCIKLHLNSVQ